MTGRVQHASGAWYADLRHDPLAAFHAGPRPRLRRTTCRADRGESAAAPADYRPRQARGPATPPRFRPLAHVRSGREVPDPARCRHRREAGHPHPLAPRWLAAPVAATVTGAWPAPDRRRPASAHPAHVARRFLLHVLPHRRRGWRSLHAASEWPRCAAGRAARSPAVATRVRPTLPRRSTPNPAAPSNLPIAPGAAQRLRPKTSA